MSSSLSLTMTRTGTHFCMVNCFQHSGSPKKTFSSDFGGHQESQSHGWETQGRHSRAAYRAVREPRTASGSAAHGVRQKRQTSMKFRVDQGRRLEFQTRWIDVCRISDRIHAGRRFKARPRAVASTGIEYSHARSWG